MSDAPGRRPLLGVVEHFAVGDHAAVEAALEDAQALGARALRTILSWADWLTPEGERFYRWLIARVPKELELLPCLTRTPPGLGLEERPSSPPRDVNALAAFVERLLDSVGDRLEWLELWSTANDLAEWDHRLDPDWLRFSRMVAAAASAARARGKRVVLAGTCPQDPSWLRLAGERGLLEQVDAVGLQGFPGTLEHDWEEWAGQVDRARAVLERFGCTPPLWITETGYSTCRGDELRQVEAFARALEAPVERVYWGRLADAPSEGVADPRRAHLGLRRADRAPKLLHRLWASGGVEAARDAARMARAKRPSRRRHVLVTGGAGFIGTNLADRLLREGTPVVVFDNLSRPGVERNLAWLRQVHGELVQVELGDVRDRPALARAVEGASAVFHFAAQVAVTTSLDAPAEDFEINARGTLNLLECVRAQADPPPVVFTSTNKVYGALEDLALVETETRYEPRSKQLRGQGVSERRGLDFHSPYGCSKGAADQYVLDYGRTYSLRTCVFRMSCIYGPHQFGTEDQGWVAHFLIRAIEGKPITLYGDGKQVRDVLFVEDLVEAFLRAQARIEELAGEAFNVGGGPENTSSLLELLSLIEGLTGKSPPVRFSPWRTADQRYYVSDYEKLRAAIAWAPRVPVRAGIERLYEWLLESRGLARPRLLAGEVAR